MDSINEPPPAAAAAADDQSEETHDVPLSDYSISPPNNNNNNNTHLLHLSEGDAPAPAPKRRRKQRQFPGMISSSSAVLGLRALRPSSKSDDPNTSSHLPPSKIQRPNPPDKDPATTESMVAAAVGFPLDSLTEEEISANVVPLLGGSDQKNYIVVRNHIISFWRSNSGRWITLEDAFGCVGCEHHSLVHTAYTFLLHHGYINFGLAPAIAAAKMGSFPYVENVNIVVVGAGIAGLIASRQLISMGFKVAVVEGRRRPGGRVKTRRMQGKTGGGVMAAFDIGASVITGINGNPMGVLARQMGFPLHKVRDVCPLYLPDGRAIDTEVDSKVEVCFNRLLDRVCKLRQSMMEEVRTVDVSLGTVLEAFRRVYGVAEDPQERMLLNWHLANLEYANASMMSELSLGFWDQDDPYEMGGDHCFIPGGNTRFIRPLAEGLPIFYDREVDCIKYGDDGVLVHAGCQEFRGDAVLCTVPLGVLKRGRIRFVPDLPQKKKDAISRLGFGLLNKVAILFPFDFWGGEIDTFGHLTEESCSRGEFFLFYSYSSVSGGPLLVALVAGEAAIRMEETSPIETVRKVLEVLRGIFDPKGVEVPEPVEVVCTRWGKDRFSHGSYSFVGIGSSGDDYDILAESVGGGRVFFAGEATNRQYPATMQGAFLSGMREAANILRVSQKLRDRKVCRDDMLDRVFEDPDVEFGSFSALFNPSDRDSSALLRVGFGDRKPPADRAYLYCLLSRKGLDELAAAEGDDSRLRMVIEKFGASLYGRQSLNDDIRSLVCGVEMAMIKKGVLKQTC